MIEFIKFLRNHRNSAIKKNLPFLKNYPLCRIMDQISLLFEPLIFFCRITSHIKDTFQKKSCFQLFNFGKIKLGIFYIVFCIEMIMYKMCKILTKICFEDHKMLYLYLLHTCLTQNRGFMGDIVNNCKSKENKPKMAYSRDLPKIARQQCGIMD